MKQAMVKNMDEAERFCKAARCQAAAYWVSSKSPLDICRMEKISKNAAITWRNNANGLWWSATLTIADKARKDGLI